MEVRQIIALFTVGAILFDIILFDPQSKFIFAVFEHDETSLNRLKFPFPYLKMGKNAIF